MRYYIEGFIVGVCVVIASAMVWSFIQLDKTVNTDHSNLAQVVTFLNQQIAANQKTSPVPTK